MGLQNKPRVWVLGDEHEEGGPYVTNAKSDATVFAPMDGIKKVVVEHPRTGKMLKKVLVPTRQLGTDGRFVLVKIGDERVPVRPDALVNPADFTPREEPRIEPLREREPVRVEVSEDHEFVDDYEDK